MRQSNRRLMRLLVLLLAMAMVAAACGSSSEEPTETADVQSPSESENEAEEESTDEEPEARPEEEQGEAQSEEPLELTASYRGVTETEIVMGVAAIDAAQIEELFGIDIGVFNLENFLNSQAEALNESGGIHGRNLSIIISSFLPIGAADSERVCTELMEDNEVFVVMGQFLEDNALCITETHGHPYVGHFGENQERKERSNGLFFAVEMEQTLQRTAGTSAMIAAGDFDDRNVAIYYEADPDLAYAEAVMPLLDEAGVNVVGTYSPGAATTDTVANEAATDAIVQRMDADGADLVLNMSNIALLIQSIARVGLEIDVAMTNGQAADRNDFQNDWGIDDDVMLRTFAVTASKPVRVARLADPLTQECIANYDARFSDEPLDLASDDIVNGVSNMCAAFALTVKILEAAGPDLTPESFITGGESLGNFVLPWIGEASITPDKHSAGSNVQRYVFSPDDGFWVPEGDPIAAK